MANSKRTFTLFKSLIINYNSLQSHKYFGEKVLSLNLIVNWGGAFGVVWLK